MHKARRIIFILTLGYIVCVIALFALNGFTLSKTVERRPIDPSCVNNPIKNNIFDFRCAETADFKIGNYIDWINWYYFSNNMGNDVARYLPLDVLTLTIINGVGYIFLRKKRS